MVQRYSGPAKAGSGRPGSRALVARDGGPSGLVPRAYGPAAYTVGDLSGYARVTAFANSVSLRGRLAQQKAAGRDGTGLGMSRRGMTVLIGAVLVVFMTVLIGQAPVPYVQLEPGPTFDTLGKDNNNADVIVINGADTSTSAGQLRFLTVGVVPELTLLEAIRGWINGDDAVVPRELVYPPDQTQEEIDKRNAEDFTNSQSAAETAALSELGYPQQIVVQAVSPGSPADGVLRTGDVITSVDGVPATNADTLLNAIRGKPAGSTLTLQVVRDGQSLTVQATTRAGEDGVPRIGFTPELKSSAPFTIDIPIEGIGGPSAGLMLALGIIDKIKPEDLTGGKIIAGTGTIDPAGTVGPIGGIPQKIIGAKDAGATVFLTPKDNCAEAVANARPGLMLVRVDTLDMALTALDTLRAGGVPQLCPGAPS
jgi:PDZ domain-containing protein